MDDSIDFNALSLEEQIEIMANATQMPGTALLCFASKLGEMSENKERMLIAHVKGEPDGFATIDMGQSVLFAFTSKERFDSLPNSYKEHLYVEEHDIDFVLEFVVRNSPIDGIVFNPFSYEDRIFFANRDVITLAW